MNTYVVLIRGINVGGKNKVAMSSLKECLMELGFSEVSTYIASGNVILRSKLGAKEVKKLIESILPKQFQLDDEMVKVLVLTPDQLKSVVDSRPTGFGEQPDKYHNDAIFLIDIDIDRAMGVFSPKEGIDRVWPGDGVIYSQRLSALRSKSRLSKAISTPEYKSMTIRNWNTTTKLLDNLNHLH
jgi:uncharacterized protein (DUF1697 family)